MLRWQNSDLVSLALQTQNNQFPQQPCHPSGSAPEQYLEWVSKNIKRNTLKNFTLILIYFKFVKIKSVLNDNIFSSFAQVQTYKKGQNFI
jgi:hypothetical protein